MPKRSVFGFLAPIALFPLFALLCACRSAQPALPDTSLRPDPKDVRVDIRSPMQAGPSEEEIRKFQPDVRMVALFARGTLTVRIRNVSDRAIMVGPGNFALITGRGKVHPFDEPDVQAKFPQAVIDPGGMATGQFRLRGHGDLTGRHIVFRHPALKPSRCRVELPPPPPMPQAAPKKKR